MRAINGLLCRRNLAEFVKCAWSVLNPGRKLEWADYLDAICLHLTAVTQGRIRRLLITQPPNTLKSTIASVCWPAWTWVDKPETRFLCASNDGPLATRDAVAMRDLVESDWYQSTFRPTWELKDDQDVKTWFSNTAGGHRISYSVAAKVTGKKGDVLLVDDANDARRVRSAVDRRAVIDWHDNAFSGRFADEKSSPEVVVGQRLDRDDLIGHLKRKGGWEELRLSEEYEPEFHCRTSIWSDPRTEPGQFLRPNRFGPKERDDAISRLGPRSYGIQHGQKELSSDATWFDRGKVNIIAAAPVGTTAVRYWDTAASKGETACLTAGVLIGRTPAGRFVVIDCVAGRYSPAERNAIILATAGMDRRRPGVTVTATVVEQEPGGSGMESVQNIITLLAGFNARADRVTGSKDTRLQPLAAQWAVGNVDVVDGPWTTAFLEEMESMPGGEYRDRSDAAGGGFNHLTAGGTSTVPATADAGRSVHDELPADVYG